MDSPALVHLEGRAVLKTADPIEKAKWTNEGKGTLTHETSG